MLGFSYPTKAALKASKGKPLAYVETSLFGAEYHGDGEYTGVGPAPYDRRWYATVVVRDGVIARVS